MVILGIFLNITCNRLTNLKNFPMKILYYLIFIICNILVTLASLHYLKIGDSDYLVPDIKWMDLTKQNIDFYIRRTTNIENLLTFILLIVALFIGAKAFKKRRMLKRVAYTSNILLGISFFFLIMMANVGSLQLSPKDNYITVFRYLFLLFYLNAVLFNIHFYANLVKPKKVHRVFFAIFLPFMSLFDLDKHTYLKPFDVVWGFKDDKEFAFRAYNINKQGLNDESLVWHKGLEEWITLKELKSIK